MSLGFTLDDPGSLVGEGEIGKTSRPLKSENIFSSKNGPTYFILTLSKPDCLLQTKNSLGPRQPAKSNVLIKTYTGINRHDKIRSNTEHMIRSCSITLEIRCYWPQRNRIEKSNFAVHKILCIAKVSKNRTQNAIPKTKMWISGKRHGPNASSLWLKDQVRERERKGSLRCFLFSDNMTW